MNKLGFSQENVCNLYCDNKVAICFSMNHVQHDRIKLVEVDRYFIKKKLECKIINLPLESSIQVRC